MLNLSLKTFQYKHSRCLKNFLYFMWKNYFNDKKANNENELTFLQIIFFENTFLSIVQLLINFFSFNTILKTFNLILFIALRYFLDFLNYTHCGNRFYFLIHIKIKNDMKALKILERLFLFSVKKVKIGSKSFL